MDGTNMGIGLLISKLIGKGESAWHLCILPGPSHVTNIVLSTIQFSYKLIIILLLYQISNLTNIMHKRMIFLKSCFESALTR